MLSDRIGQQAVSEVVASFLTWWLGPARAWCRTYSHDSVTRTLTLGLYRLMGAGPTECVEELNLHECWLLIPPGCLAVCVP